MFVCFHSVTTSDDIDNMSYRALQQKVKTCRDPDHPINARSNARTLREYLRTRCEHVDMESQTEAKPLGLRVGIIRHSAMLTADLNCVSGIIRHSAMLTADLNCVLDTFQGTVFEPGNKKALEQLAKKNNTRYSLGENIGLAEWLRTEMVYLQRQGIGGYGGP